MTRPERAQTRSSHGESKEHLRPRAAHAGQQALPLPAAERVHRHRQADVFDARARGAGRAGDHTRGARARERAVSLRGAVRLRAAHALQGRPPLRHRPAPGGVGQRARGGRFGHVGGRQAGRRQGRQGQALEAQEGRPQARAPQADRAGGRGARRGRAACEGSRREQDGRGRRGRRSRQDERRGGGIRRPWGRRRHERHGRDRRRGRCGDRDARRPQDSWSRTKVCRSRDRLVRKQRGDGQPRA